MVLINGVLEENHKKNKLWHLIVILWKNQKRKE